jgi:hypothetical protein
MIDLFQQCSSCRISVRPLFFFRPPPHAVPSLPPTPFLPLPASACRHLPTRALRICISPSHPTRRTLFFLYLTSIMNLHYEYSARMDATSTTSSARLVILARGATGLRTRKRTARSAQQLGTVIQPARLPRQRGAQASAQRLSSAMRSSARRRKRRRAPASAVQPPSPDATPPRLGKRRKPRPARVLRAMQPPSLVATPRPPDKPRKPRPARASSAVPENSALRPVKRPKPRLAANLAVPENSALRPVKLQKQKLAMKSAPRAGSATPAASPPICSAKVPAPRGSTATAQPGSPPTPSVYSAPPGFSPAQRAIRSRINVRGDVTQASFPISVGTRSSSSARRALAIMLRGLGKQRARCAKKVKFPIRAQHFATPVSMVSIATAPPRPSRALPADQTPHRQLLSITTAVPAVLVRSQTRAPRIAQRAPSAPTAPHQWAMRAAPASRALRVVCSAPAACSCSTLQRGTRSAQPRPSSNRQKCTRASTMKRAS